VSGAARAIAAYIAWGLFPFYWKQLTFVPALEVMAHRMWWSFVTLGLLMFWRSSWPRLGRALTAPRILGTYAAAAMLISINWFSYIWAVNHNLIVETSLGYFINPMMTVALGVVAFGERLRPLQWAAVSFAGAGVLYLTLSYGSLPWIAIALATSFAGYSVVKKLAPLSAREGLTIETLLLAPVVLAYLLYRAGTGDGAFGNAGLRPTLFLAGAGVVTTLPLLLFASAVQRVPLSLIGVIQYISPTIQLLLGVFVYGEAFSRTQQIGFGAVWAGVVIFAWDSWRASPRRRRALEGLG
jgi:chloramphenicol-sensitive protein RarD